MELKKNIISVGFVNILSVVSGLILGFIIPSVLSIEGYSYLKTYTFYVSYVGILHFGFIDGMYLKYGGKSFEDVNKEELKCEHRIFFIIQLLVTFIAILASIFLKDKILFIVALTIIPVNILSFNRSFFQATGQFKKYTNMMYFYIIFYFFGNLILIFLFNSDNYMYYCIVTLIANLVVAIYLEKKLFEVFKKVDNIYFKDVWKNIKTGFFVLLGNFSVLIFCAIDRWFIKLFYSVEDFAYYSFAISVINIMNVLINCISITMYNYIARNYDEKRIVKLKEYILLISCISTISYFVFYGIIKLVLNKYIPSLQVISVLYLSYPYMMIINILYINIYKSKKQEKKYFSVVIKMLAVACIYNVIALYFKNMTAIAIATTLSYITWYIYSIKDFKFLKIVKRERFYLILVSFFFIACINLSNWLLAGIIYSLLIFIVTMLLYKNEFFSLLRSFLISKKI